MISTGDSASTQLNLMFTVSFDVGFTHASLLLEWMATDHGFAIDMPLRSDEPSRFMATAKNQKLLWMISRVRFKSTCELLANL
jgi:hypothetical protein